jgi:hypothetical protein
MPDSFSIPTRAENANIATDCIGGIHHLRAKIQFGDDNTAIDVSSTNPMPVAIMSGGGSSGGGLTNTELRASPVSVTGTFWQATQPVSGTVAVSGSVAVTGPLTDSQLRATPVPISGSVGVTGTVTVANGLDVDVLTLPSLPAGANAIGSVSVSNFPASQTVAGTVSVGNFPATQAVSGPLTDTQLRASPVAVSGNFWQALQPVSISGTVTVSGPLTDTQLRASAVSVTGPVTDTQLRASALSTRDLKDNARTLFSAATVVAGVASVTTEAMLSLVPTRAGVAAAGATSIAATSGKTLRITAIVFSTRSTSAAVLSGRCVLRMNPSGAAVATSPILAILSATQQAAALAEGGDTCVLPLPDGIEISGTQQIGLSQVCSATTGVVYASIIGFEY